jgi:hypothetical protein
MLHVIAFRTSSFEVAAAMTLLFDGKRFFPDEDWRLNSIN